VKVLQGAGLLNSAMLQRFLRESRAAAKVEHPAVTRMLHVDVSEGGVPFQVQELVRGVPLSSALNAEKGALAAGVRASSQRARPTTRANARVGGFLSARSRTANRTIRDRTPVDCLLPIGQASLASGKSRSIATTMPLRTARKEVLRRGFFASQ